MKRHRNVYTAAFVLATALLLSGCADPDTEPSAADQELLTFEEPAPPSGESGAPSEAVPPPSSDRPSPALPRCEVEVEAGVLDTISAQLDAFARGDYPAALDAASAAFRAGTDVHRFQTMIERNYGLLTERATAELTACRSIGPDAAEVLVDVTTAAGVRAAFAYRLRLDAGRWAIDGAARLSQPPAVT